MPNNNNNNNETLHISFMDLNAFTDNECIPYTVGPNSILYYHIPNEQ